MQDEAFFLNKYVQFLRQIQCLIKCWRQPVRHSLARLRGGAEEESDSDIGPSCSCPSSPPTSMDEISFPKSKGQRLQVFCPCSRDVRSMQPRRVVQLWGICKKLECRGSIVVLTKGCHNRLPTQVEKTNPGTNQRSKCLGLCGMRVYIHVYIIHVYIIHVSSLSAFFKNANNNLAKLRRCVSRVHFENIARGTTDPGY